MSAAAGSGGRRTSFRQALAESDGLGLSPEELDAALDPATGLESAPALVDRMLAGEVDQSVQDLQLAADLRISPTGSRTDATQQPCRWRRNAQADGSPVYEVDRARPERHAPIRQSRRLPAGMTPSSAKRAMTNPPRPAPSGTGVMIPIEQKPELLSPGIGFGSRTSRSRSQAARGLHDLLPAPADPAGRTARRR